MALAYPMLEGGLGRQMISTPTSWIKITKPRGASQCMMWVMGAGGGGGNGFSRAAGANGGGGGGGGCGAFVRAIFAADDLPDGFWAQVGLGGAATTAGAASRLALFPEATPTAAFQFLVAGGGGGGGNGSATAAGTAGSAGTASTAQMSLASLGTLSTISGATGGAGGAQTGAVGVSPAVLTAGTLNTGGAGGAGAATTDFSGGVVNGAGIYVPVMPGGAAGGGVGNDGYAFSWKPPIFLGGSGGGSFNTGAAGRGGNGGPGSGGGGGGAGVTGGAGGRGGDGLIIISWT
jgi:hypothetical protein